MGKNNNNSVDLAKPAAPNTIEIGTSMIGSMPSIFEDEFVDMSKVQVEDFKDMLDNDGTVQALYNTIVMPILGSNWTIEADDPDNPAAVEQSAWVEEQLRTPPHKGGMSTPFDLVLAQALRAVVEGFAAFEKVYTISEEGKVVYKKIAWRDPTTVTIRTDDRGGFNGLRQRAFIGSSYEDNIRIPMERCWVYTYGKEFHTLKGRSAFTAAYSAYDKKRRLLYLAEQQAQADAFKIKIVKGREGGGQDELDETTDAVDDVGTKATIGVPYGVEVDTLNNSHNMDLLPLIEFQNAEMARSILAMFILLGTGSKTGSYSLSQDQSDFFVQALMSIRKGVEQHVTSYLLPDLYKFNFETPEYGTFRFEDITDSTIDIIKQTFIKLTEKDKLPETVALGIVQKMADKLEIEYDSQEEQKQAEEEAAKNPPPVPPVPPTVPPEQNPPTPENPSPTGKENFSLPTVDGGMLWKRDLTVAERRINFTALNSKLDTLESDVTRQVQPIWDQLVSDAILKIGPLIDKGQYDKINEKTLFDENLKNQYVKVLKEAGLEAYIWGKNTSADEIAVKAPATPKESKDYFRDNAVAIVDKQFADLIYKIQNEVLKGRRKDQLSKTQLSLGDVMALIGNVFANFFDSNVGLTAVATVAAGINRGRKDVFSANSEKVYAYQYSAVLDGSTCPQCSELDGKVLDETSYKRTQFDPPIHFNCRCIWVAILKEELNPPAITGFPEMPGGVLAPSLSHTHQEQFVELARRAVQDEVDRLLAED